MFNEQGQGKNKQMCVVNEYIILVNKQKRYRKMVFLSRELTCRNISIA